MILTFSNRLSLVLLTLKDQNASVCVGREK
jgi:hypothetical protein